MNFITFNIIMLMIKMSLEQVNIIGLEISVILLSLVNYIFVLKEYSTILSLIIGIFIIFVVTIFQLLFQLFTEEKKIHINFNSSL